MNLNTKFQNLIGGLNKDFGIGILLFLLTIGSILGILACAGVIKI